MGSRRHRTAKSVGRGLRAGLTRDAGVGAATLGFEIKRASALNRCAGGWRADVGGVLYRVPGVGVKRGSSGKRCLPWGQGGAGDVICRGQW